MEIREQVYVLRKITPTIAVFFIDRPLARGWPINSDPPPDLIAEVSPTLWRLNPPWAR
jgi:hypothetical protein